MKGPYERLKYDLRRTWECPECHHREHTGGDVTSLRCSQNMSGTSCEHVMRLIDDGVKRTDGTPIAPREINPYASLTKSRDGQNEIPATSE